MIILGIDPGTAIMGYGIIEACGNRFLVLDYGAIRTPAKTPLQDRLLHIYQELRRIIIEYAPQHLAVEELFFNRNTNTAMAVGQARGVVMLTAAQEGMAVGEFTPSQVKQAVVGYGKAEKQQVQQMVKTLLNLPEIPKPDDVADALAIAICYAHSYRFQQNLLERGESR